MCWFDLVRNMWGFLATPHSPITANENLWNKPYFPWFISQPCIYLDNSLFQIDHLRHFWSVYPSRDGIPLGTLDDCWAKQTFRRFDMFRTPSKNGHLKTLRDWLSLADWNLLYLLYRLQWCDNISIIFWCNSRQVSESFSGVFLKIWSEPSILEVNILLCTTFWADLQNICPSWGYCAFLHEWNCEKFIIKNHTKLRWDVTGFWV